MLSRHTQYTTLPGTLSRSTAQWKAAVNLRAQYLSYDLVITETGFPLRESNYHTALYEGQIYTSTLMRVRAAGCSWRSHKFQCVQPSFVPASYEPRAVAASREIMNSPTLCRPPEGYCAVRFHGRSSDGVVAWRTTRGRVPGCRAITKPEADKRPCRSRPGDWLQPQASALRFQTGAFILTPRAARLLSTSRLLTRNYPAA
ncbi:hypothetical protein VTK56DRAFT_9995 [Thermocarpiscus australiensis]